LPAYKVPKSVEFVESLPRDASLKIRRSAMVAERGG
jgi:bile acid-coenzyme A ligase